MLLPLSLLFLNLVIAVRIPFNVHLTDTPVSALARRAPIAVGNTGNAQYVANISIAGNTLPVLIDTGSSDLWVYFPKTPSNLDQIKDTGKRVSLSYAVGTAAGNAQRANVGFGGYTIKDQAFLLVENAGAFASDIEAQGYDGLLGLGPNSGSLIRKKLDKTNADTPLQNIFNGAKLDSNYITFLLDRKGDPNDPFKGEMSISEIIPGFENITSMPKLDVDTVTRLLKSDQHWQALTDKDTGITGPDGKPVKVESIVPGAPDGQLVAVIDSGFTFSQVPREVADQIYGRVKGAVYDSVREWWLVPCGQYLNIAFNFGGVSYPIHPLDTVDDNFNKIDASGKKVCIGSFQPITSAFSMLGHYDMILGMNFLRSVYTLLDFGTWIDSGTGHPFIQMSALTDVAGGRKDFVTIRLGGDDTIDDARWQLLPFDQLVASPVSDAEKKKKYQEMILSRWPYILLGCLAFLVLTIGLCIWKCCCRKKKKNQLAGNRNLGFGFGRKKGEAGAGVDEDMYNRGPVGDKDGHGRPSYLQLESQTNLAAANRYGSSADLTGPLSPHYSENGRPSAQFERASPHQQPPYSPFHDKYSASSGDLHSPYPQQAYDDYSQSGNSGYGAQPQYQQQQHQGYGAAGDGHGYPAR